MEKINKKVSCFILLLVVFLLANITKVYASDFSMQLTGDKNTIKPGETITVQVSLKDIEKMSTGVSVFLATIDYDKNVFEQLKEDDIKTLNNWSGMMYNEENGKIIVENHNFNEEEKAMFEVVLKAKTEIKEDKGSFSIKEAESSMGITAMKADEASLVLKVQKDNTMLVIIISSILILAILAGIIIYFILKKKKGEN